MNVVNVNVVKTTFTSLGWDSLSLSETGEWLLEAGIDPAGFIAYCKALLAAPNGLDVSTLTTTPAGQVPYITDWLRGKGVVF